MENGRSFPKTQRKLNSKEHGHGVPEILSEKKTAKMLEGLWLFRKSKSDAKHRFKRIRAFEMASWENIIQTFVRRDKEGVVNSLEHFTVLKSITQFDEPTSA